MWPAPFPWTVLSAAIRLTQQLLDSTNTMSKGTAAMPVDELQQQELQQQEQQLAVAAHTVAAEAAAATHADTRDTRSQ